MEIDADAIVVDCIRDIFFYDARAIVTPEDRLERDIGLDSLRMLSLQFELEKRLRAALGNRSMRIPLADLAMAMFEGDLPADQLSLIVEGKLQPIDHPSEKRNASPEEEQAADQKWSQTKPMTVARLQAFVQQFVEKELRKIAAKQ